MNGLRDIVAMVNGKINDFVWGLPMLVLLVGTGILMTVLTKGFQLSHFRFWMAHTVGAIFKNKHVTAHTAKEDRSISQFQSLCTALAATIGTGNIAGVAAAIAAGGPGAIFWMWIVAVFGMMTNFSENVLGIYYRRKNAAGEWSGGAMYYLRDGLGSFRGCKQLGKILGLLFSIFCIFVSFGIGNMGQINSIATNMRAVFSIPNWVTGVFLMVVAALVVVGGLKRIAAVTEKLVPVMALLYVVGALAIVAMNYRSILPAFASIFKGAFAMKAVGGGIVGSGVKAAVTWGMKRGVFSNEAGLGSSVMVHSSSNVKEPVAQGMWGIFEVFADTLVVCTLTALVILTSGVYQENAALLAIQSGTVTSAMVGAPLSAAAFSTVFGRFGVVFVAVCLLLFAFTSLLGSSYYGERGLQYLTGTDRWRWPYRAAFLLAVVAGSVGDVAVVWQLADIFNGLMALPNLCALLLLSPEALGLLNGWMAVRTDGAAHRGRSRRAGR